MAETIKKRFEGNYLGQGNNDFPLDCETLEYIAHNRRMTEMLGAIAGDKVILNGCSQAKGNIEEGYVFLKTAKYPNGEVMYFAGSTTDSTNCHVVEENEAVTSDGHQYPQAYSKRYLAPGMSDSNNSYKWADFIYLTQQTNKELHERVTKLEKELEGLQGVPVGTVEMWAGQALPAGGKYMLCNGDELAVADYKELHDVIGDAFNTARDMDGRVYTTAKDHFRLPDLRGRFICGQAPSGDYASKGTTGGEKTHLLTAEELASHTHDVKDMYLAEHHKAFASGSESGHFGLVNDKLVDGGTGNVSGDNGLGGSNGSMDKDNDMLPYMTHATEKNNTGATPHENRPPYYVLAYIIKVKS